MLSSNSNNLGKQILVWDYRQEARSKGFNQVFCDILPYGLYTGGELFRESDTTINIGLIVCVIRSENNDKVALRIETTEKQPLSLASSYGSPYVDNTKPYIVLRFGWIEETTNYMNMLAVGWSADPNEKDEDKLHPFDIILGKVLFQETSPGSGHYIIATEKSFDYTRRQKVFIKETEGIAGQFRVSASEQDNNKVFISGGKLNTSERQFRLSGRDFPEGGFPPTEGLGRIDLVVLDAHGEFKLIQGTPSANYDGDTAVVPKYQNYKVLAEIRRGPYRTDILGSDIRQRTDGTILGPISAESFLLADSDKILPANARNIEEAFRYIMHHSIAISPEDTATLAVVLRRNIKWGTDDSEGEVYAAAVPVKDTADLFISKNVEAVLNEIAGPGRTTENLKGLADAIEDLTDYLNSLVYCNYNQLINSIATDRPVFFAKMKKNSTAIFNLKVEGPTMNGAICMAVSIAGIDDLKHSGAGISILSTSIPAFFNGSVIYLATNIDGNASDYVFVGFTASATGLFDVSMQAISSELDGVLGVNYSISMNIINNFATFPVSDGYLAGYPVVKSILELDAFRKWSPTHQYQKGDPVFHNSIIYYALNSNLNCSPYSHTDKWTPLVNSSSGSIDIAEGAKTPQLFYRPGLIISNSTASKLGKDYQDHGREYLSENSKVYHLDDEHLLDQHQDLGSKLTIIPKSPETAGAIAPHCVYKDSEPELLITNDPIIKRPLKEASGFYYGSYSIPLTMPDGNGMNTLDYWFKIVNGQGIKLLSATLPTGEAFYLSLRHEEPFWNDNFGVEGPNNFPFNKNVLLPGTLAFNKRSVSAGIDIVQNYGVTRKVTPITFPRLPLPNEWSHIALEIGNHSITIFMNKGAQSIARLTSGFGGDTSIVINPQQEPIALDEIMIDWSVAMSFDDFIKVSDNLNLPWASHEWEEGWMTIYADDPDKVDSNLAMYFFPVGSVLTQASVDGEYDPAQTPWARFHCFKESQFDLQGEVSPIGGNNNEKTRFWQRVS